VSVISPPSGGPSAGATSIGAVEMFITLSSEARSTELTRMSCPEALIKAPVTPCAARAAMKAGRLGLRPQSMERSVNPATDQTNSLLPPTLSDSHAQAGITIEAAST